MTPNPLDQDGGPLDLPGSMADIFLALVAVVILILLSLLPAIQKPGGLAPQPAAEPDWGNVVIDGKAPALYVAESADIRVIENETRVGLNDILQDQGLSEGLRAAAQGRSILLVIEPEGQESAFLFSSLAGSLGVGQFYQLRVDAQCAYMNDATLARICRSAKAGAAGQ